MRRTVEWNGYHYYQSRTDYRKLSVDEYTVLPILEAPLLFLYKQNESLMEVAWRIYNRIVVPFVTDKEGTRNVLIQWEEMCRQKAAVMEIEQEKEWKRREEERMRREEEDRRRLEALLNQNDQPTVNSPFTHVHIASNQNSVSTKPYEISGVQDEYNTMFEHPQPHSLKNTGVGSLQHHYSSYQSCLTQNSVLNSNDNLFASSSDMEYNEIVNSNQSTEDSPSKSNQLNDVSKGLPGGADGMLSDSPAAMLSNQEEKPQIVVGMEEEMLAVHPESDQDLTSFISLHISNLDDSSWCKQVPFFPLVYPIQGDWHDSLVLCNDNSISFASAIHNISVLHLILVPIITPKFEKPPTFDFYDDTVISSSSSELLSNPVVETIIKASSTTLHSTPSLWDMEKEELGVDLEECFKLYTQHGSLDENNKWYCPNCQDHICAESVTRIDRLPEILVLQLERFEYSQNVSSYGYGYGGNRRKISTLVRFPIRDLNMRPWLYDASSVPAEDCIYDLTAICNHSGSSSGGHYYCYARDENDGSTRWYEYNDSGVYEKGEVGLVRDSAYVLFYQRRKGRVDSREVCEKVKAMHEEYIALNPKESPSTNEMHVVNDMSTVEGSSLVNESSTNQTVNIVKTKSSWSDYQRIGSLSPKNEAYLGDKQDSSDVWIDSSSSDDLPDPIYVQPTQKPVEVTIPRETVFHYTVTDPTPIEVVIDNEEKRGPLLKEGTNIYLEQKISSNVDPALSDSDNLYILSVYSQTSSSTYRILPDGTGRDVSVHTTPYRKT